MTSHHEGDYKSGKLVIHDKEKGTLTIKPRALDITLGGDKRYWKFSSDDAASPVELLQVCWLQVKGKVQSSYFLPDTQYAVKFNVELKPENFGWAGRPVYFMVGINNQLSWKGSDVSTNSPGIKFDVPMDKLLSFRVPKGTNGKMVEFGMYETWKGNWKGGLVINEIVIEPVSSSWD